MGLHEHRAFPFPALAAALVAAVLLAPVCALAVDKGAAAPPFEVAGARGPVKLSDYQGKLLYLDFWASWCVPCRQSFPWMNEMLAKYEGNGLRILGINVDKKAADAAKFLERVPAKFELAFDSEGRVPKSYGVKAMPSSYLIAPGGQVIEVHRGFAEEDRAELERKIRQALNLR
jgi:cytochrome c biogenesis protein CcmG, thiol:disulfide interchange protein DsbE